MNTLESKSVYIIAEAGVNHNGQRDIAFSLVDVAADSGADAVKFQTFDASRLASKSAPKAAYQNKNTDCLESQLDMLKRLELPVEWHTELQAHARHRGIEFISTAFDLESLKFLNDIDIPFFKVPSGELTNGPLLWHFAQTKKPLILSTGMATLSEVEQGLAIVAHALNNSHEPASMLEVWRSWTDPDVRMSLQGQVSLLHCTSQYPTPANMVNLRAMDTLANAFGLRVGYSDHTEGCLVPVAAVARGATIIEKHFTLDKSMPGPDHKASLMPEELGRMVSEIRTVEQMLGDGSKAPQACEWDTRMAARQQVVATREISIGSVFVRADLTTARNGSGLDPVMLWELVGSPARRDYFEGEKIEP